VAARVGRAVCRSRRRAEAEWCITRKWCAQKFLPTKDCGGRLTRKWCAGSEVAAGRPLGGRRSVAAATGAGSLWRRASTSLRSIPSASCLLLSQVNWVKPSHAKPRQAKPSQAKPSQGKASQGKPRQAKASQGKPRQAKPSHAKPRQAKPSQAKPSQAKPSQAKARQAKASQAKPRQAKPSLLSRSTKVFPCSISLLVLAGCHPEVRPPA